jgi:hypothetical protein
MVEKAPTPEETPAPCDRLRKAEAQVSALEARLGELQTHLQHLDERARRGERLMMEMQLEQRHMAKVLQAVAAKLDVPPSSDSVELEG